MKKVTVRVNQQSAFMFDGTKLDGPASLRQAILNHSDAFIGAFTENFLAYGIGRVIDYHDMPFVRAIEHEAAKNNNRFSSFILGIVKSPPFQMRRAEENENAPTDAVAGNLNQETKSDVHN